jgi:hypothetical protein
MTFTMSLLNPAFNPVRFALWTLRDKPAQIRLALCNVSSKPIGESDEKSNLGCCFLRVLDQLRISSASAAQAAHPDFNVQCR